MTDIAKDILAQGGKETVSPDYVRPRKKRIRYSSIHR